MEQLISKKFTEVEELLDRFIQEATILSSVDKSIDHRLDHKLTELKQWLVRRDAAKDQSVEYESPVTAKTSPVLKPIKSVIRSNPVPSFMAHTFSSLAASTIQPRSDSISRSNSTERSRSNGRSRLYEVEHNATPSFMAPKGIIYTPRSSSTSRSHSNNRSRSVDRDREDPPSILKKKPTKEEPITPSLSTEERPSTVYFSANVTMDSKS